GPSERERWVSRPGLCGPTHPVVVTGSFVVVGMLGVFRAGTAFVPGGVVRDRRDECAARGRPPADTAGAAMVPAAGDVGGVGRNPMHGLGGCPCGDGRHPAHEGTAARTGSVATVVKQGPRSDETVFRYVVCCVAHIV